ncbi:MAG: hypothetical protein RIT34_1483, partial [Bacteroidota bacterium]
MATPIKFGTDGWRAIIAAEFTVENVARVTEATGLWLKERFENPSVVLGHDCRFAGELFMETAAKVLLAQGIHVKLSRGFVSTPMISLAANQLGCEVGIILTASHNPPSYNGFKLKAKFGGPLEPEKINEVEALIPDTCSIDFNSIDLQAAQKSGQLEEIDIETRYINHVKANFDLAAIDQSGLHLMYDAMYGAGQRVMPLILPKVSLLHCEHNPSFMGTAPEPIAKNLQELAQTIKNQG